MESVIKNDLSAPSPYDRFLKNAPSFQTYDDNGGNVVAIGGDGFAIIGSDTRLSTGYQIYSRDQSKLFKVTDKVILGSTGCWTDALAFSRILEIRAKMYQYDHNQELTLDSAAQLISIMLYNRRFFPYNVGDVLVGLEDDNQGYVYSYDCVGNFEKFRYRSTGSAGHLMQSFLDNQVGKLNIDNLSSDEKKINLEEALTIMKEIFASVTEREISCGDSIHICIITKDGIKEEKIPLRKD